MFHGKRNRLSDSADTKYLANEIIQKAISGENFDFLQINTLWIQAIKVIKAEIWVGSKR